MKELTDLNACSEGLEWARTQPNMQAAWNNCTRSDWLIWYLGKIGYSDQSQLRLLAVAFAREVQHLMTDPRSVTALDVAEAYAHGNATEEQLAEARAAAAAAARAAAADAADAWAAAWAAARAAWAAASAAASAAARTAASDAAWAIADAARAASARASADAAAWAKQCEVIRSVISWESLLTLC